MAAVSIWKVLETSFKHPRVCLIEAYDLHSTASSILDSGLDDGGRFKEAACAHVSRIRFTWLDEYVCAHYIYIYILDVMVQPIQPGWTHVLWIG